MKLDNILGKILAMTKQIYLKKPEDRPTFRSSFLTGGQSPFSLIGSIGLEWWYTEGVYRRREDIANMATSLYPKLQGGDTESFCQIIGDVLQENALNQELFDSDRIFLRIASTLFDGRSVQNEKEFALRLWNKIFQALTRSMMQWIVLYPLNRIKVHSATLGFDGIILLSSDDKTIWDQICRNYSSNAKLWDPHSGTGKYNKESIFKDPTSTWLLCEVYGTDSGAIKLAGRRMSSFIAVLFSHLQHRVPNLLTKSMAEEISYSIQFPQAEVEAKCGQRYAPIGRLFPPLIDDVDILLEDISEIEKWYSLRASATPQNMQRVVTASHFIHYAIMANDLERFIHFFIALDALFGARDKVEDTVTDGIKRTFPDDLRWVERAQWLFNLRSELVHGGSSRIEDWKDLDPYRRYFKTIPLTDVGIAAMTALRNYFTL